MIYFIKPYFAIEIYFLMVNNEREVFKMQEIIINRNIIAIIVPIFLLPPFLFTFIFEVQMIFTKLFFIAIILSIITLMIILLGLFSLISLIKFGRKSIKLDENGITTYWLIKRYIPWSEIIDIKLSAISENDFLNIKAKNREISINLNNTSLKYDNDEIYEMVVSNWENSSH
ncbi:hypothetical protein R4B61_01020 [Fructilactobacillus vespulae]|uniref:hypothetical protein n=1 Tax=Fructilactobacillus vespulae TaxID=1249630 RepID=UPI0039B4804C